MAPSVGVIVTMAVAALTSEPSNKFLMMSSTVIIP